MTLPAFIPTIANIQDGMCRWPMGDPTHDMPMCGAPCERTYCEEHHKISYVPVRKRGELCQD